MNRTFFHKIYLNFTFGSPLTQKRNQRIFNEVVLNAKNKQQIIPFLRTYFLGDCIFAPAIKLRIHVF